jgi:hypothetical protein
VAKNVVVGSKKLEYALRRFPKDAAQAVARGEYLAAQLIMQDARRRAPKEDGWLEGSGYATRPDFSKQSVAVEMGFGGPSEDYVVRQHEDTSLNHPGEKAIKKGVTKVGQAKFFSNALAAMDGVARDVIADFARRFIETGRIPSWPKKIVPETPEEENGPYRSR